MTRSERLPPQSTFPLIVQATERSTRVHRAAGDRELPFIVQRPNNEPAFSVQLQNREPPFVVQLQNRELPFVV